MERMRAEGQEVGHMLEGQMRQTGPETRVRAWVRA